MRVIFVFTLLLLLLVPAYPAAAQTPDSVQTLRVDVKLVNVFVTVTDKTGAPVGSLTKDNFKLLEDDVPQNISVFARESELPLSIILAIDTSLSTKKDLKLEILSARKFSHEILRKQDAISLYQFRSTSSARLLKSWSLSRVTSRASTAASTASTWVPPPRSTTLSISVPTRS